MDKKNLFNSIKVKVPNSNTIDLSHTHNTTGQMGFMLPIMTMDCVPGDKVKVGTEAFIRMAPMLAPVMHQIDVYAHTWFVPNRILWDNWEAWITGNLVDDVEPVHPYITIPSGITSANWNLLWKLADMLGIPNPTEINGANTNELVNPFAFAAYQCIYHEFYRNQSLVPEFDYKLVDGNNDANINNLNFLRRRAWAKDYLTSALPSPQKGAEVEIPIGNFDDVPVHTSVNAPAGTIIQGTPNDIDIDYSVYDGTGTPQIFAKTSALISGAATIEDLRAAFRLQEFLEKDMRAGTRYTEWLQAHFGEYPEDARLQRPEYVGGFKTTLKISEVLQTSETASSPQGNMAGHGVAYTNGDTSFYHAKEHGYLMTILTVMPKPSYSQGMPKHFTKINDRFDYYTPEFANIGEQPILNKEVYAYTDTGNDEFGYIPRYAEYKYMNNRASRDFVNGQLDFWTLFRRFNDQPTLDEPFIECDPSQRIFAVEDDLVDKLWITGYNRIYAERKMPIYGTPSF